MQGTLSGAKGACSGGRWVEGACARGRWGSRGIFASYQEASFLRGVHMQGTLSGAKGACSG
eukprot:12054109-Ditylum_brightwellii.AAC.1